MSKKVLVNFDFNQNEIQNVRVQNLGSAPSSPVLGQLYFNSTQDKLFVYNGDEWIELDYNSAEFDADFDDKTTDDLSEGTDNKYLQGTEINEDDDITLLNNNAGYTDYGSDDFDTDFGSKSTDDLSEGTSNKYFFQHGNSEHDVNFQDESEKGEAGGYAPLNSDANIDEKYLPASASQELFIVNDYTERDDVSPDDGDKAIVLESGNTYIWDGSEWVLQSEDIWGEVNIDWTNVENKPSEFTPEEHDNTAHTTNYTDYDSADFDTDFGDKTTDDLTEGTNNKYLTGTEVNEGDNVSVLTNDAGYTKKVAETIGDGTSTSFTVTHDLGTRDLTVTVRENDSPYAEVFTDIEFSGTDEITVKFNEAPGDDEYRVVVVG